MLCLSIHLQGNTTTTGGSQSRNRGPPPPWRHLRSGRRCRRTIDTVVQLELLAVNYLSDNHRTKIVDMTATLRKEFVYRLV